MQQDWIGSLVEYLKSDDVLPRLEVCSEFAFAEQWLRMEIFYWLRQEKWTPLLVEGPYYTRLPPDLSKSWKDFHKWSDLVAMGPNGVYWLELKAIWYRQHRFRENLNEAMKDLLALAAMDMDLTAQLWADPSNDAVTYKEFYLPFAKAIEKGPQHRYLICLLQAVPESLDGESYKDNLKRISRSYLSGRSSRQILKNVEDVKLEQFFLETDYDRDVAVEAHQVSLRIIPEIFELSTIDRGELFPEDNPEGILALAVWTVSSRKSP